VSGTEQLHGRVAGDRPKRPRRRVIDFATGLAYGIGGDLEKVDEQHCRLLPARLGPDDSAGDREPRQPAPLSGDGAAPLAEPPSYWEASWTTVLPTGGRRRGEGFGLTTGP
jgi:hypothetical protein